MARRARLRRLDPPYRGRGSTDRAGSWNAELAADEDGYGQAIDRWLDISRDEPIDAIAYGAIVLRRRADDANWVRDRELPNEPRERPADHVLRLFTGLDLSNRLVDDDGLAAQTLALAEGAVIESRLRREPDRLGAKRSS